jgi:hypothetical protein
MRTSGAPADGPLTYVPIVVAVGILLALFGGPSSTLRSVDSAIRHAVGAVVDVVKSAAAAVHF